MSLGIAAARDLGLQFTDNPHWMAGQDGAYSIPLPDGTALWFFGDTLIGERIGGESLWFPHGKRLGSHGLAGFGNIVRVTSNSALILRDRTGAQGLRDYSYILDPRGEIRELVTRVPGEHPDVVRVWCMHGIESGGRVYLYYLTVRILDEEWPVPVSFELIGSGVASGTVGEWVFHRAEHDGDTLWWHEPLPDFGAAALKREEDSFAYLYGVRKAADGRQQCCLARAPLGRLDEYPAYEYLVSPEPRWSGDPSKCVTVMEGMPNEMSVSWNAYLGAFLAVHSLELTGRIVARTAPAPWGPWSEPVDLWQIQPPRLDFELPYAPLMYAGKEHPELSQDGGRVLYITYIEFEEYYPHLVEVTLA